MYTSYVYDIICAYILSRYLIHLGPPHPVAQQAGDARLVAPEDAKQTARVRLPAAHAAVLGARPPGAQGLGVTTYRSIYMYVYIYYIGIL